MNSYEYILSKQIQWALNQNITLIGSKRTRGRLAYTSKLEENLYEPLYEKTYQEFQSSDGNEILIDSDEPPKMNAVHSSSALCVNIFQFWQKINRVYSIAYACGLCNRNNKNSETILFEQKFPISKSFTFHPNIDVVIKNKPDFQYKIYAIECKFSEAYGSRIHSGLDEKYMTLKKIWDDIPNLHQFAKSICPVDNLFNHLHPSQLIKHILGCKNKYSKRGFRLLYLWYDTIGSEGYQHRKEIEIFKDVTNEDNIKFHSLSYQELIVKLSNEYRALYPEYIRYITDRYL